MVRVLLVSVFALSGCELRKEPEAWQGWYDEGSDYSVMEPVAYTDVPYSFPSSAGEGIAALDPAFGEEFTVNFATEDAPDASLTCDWATTPELPLDIEGIVTLHPRYYFKTNGCSGDDEKYYGSYFIQDAYGAIFVLGDSKVAHFDMGAKVKLKVRAVVQRFGLRMVAAHDVEAIDFGPYPIYFETATETLGPDDIGLTRRVTGVVTTEKDTFGAFKLKADNDVVYDVTLDSELSRRGVGFEVGTRLEVSGPVMFSYDIYSIVVLRVGQTRVITD